MSEPTMEQEHDEPRGPVCSVHGYDREWRECWQCFGDGVRGQDAREVIGKMLRFIDERASASVSGYGFYRPANPHDFSPDHDSCSADELAAHKAACEAYDRGEYTAPKGSEFLRDDDGKVTLHILRAPWGIGSYSETDPDAVPLIDAARAFLAKLAQEKRESEHREAAP